MGGRKGPVRTLVIGESIIDVVVTATGDRTEHAGGSPMNVAYGLARLGESVRLATVIGRDDRGNLIRRHLEDAGVELTAGSLVDRPTSVAAAVLSPAGAADYDFRIDWDPEASIDTARTELIHTGSLAAFLHPGADIVAATLENSDPSTIVTFDPNIRPSLLSDRSAARTTVERIASRASVVKLSDEDAGWLFPSRDTDEVLDELLGFGAALAVITRGSDGAVLATRTARVTVPAARVRVVDTVGAGDSFTSGVIHALAHLLRSGLDPAAVRDGRAFTGPVLERVGRFAADCASITVSRRGAQPPSKAEIAPLE